MFQQDPEPWSWRSILLFYKRGTWVGGDDCLVATDGDAAGCKSFSPWQLFSAISTDKNLNQKE